MTKSFEITEAAFEESVLKAPMPVLVDFWGPTCGPCHLMEPVLDELAGEYAGRVVFYRLNRDENPKIANRYNVMSLPTLIMFKDGQPFSSIIGFTGETRRKLKENISAVL
jgi:thioredoxin 1